MQIEKLTDNHFTCIVAKDEAISQGYIDPDDHFDKSAFMDYVTIHNEEIRQLQDTWNDGIVVGCTETVDGVILVAIAFVKQDIVEIKRDIIMLLLQRAQNKEETDKDFYNLHLMADSMVLNTIRQRFEEDDPRAYMDDDTSDWEDVQSFTDEETGRYRCVIAWKTKTPNTSVRWLMDRLRERKIHHEVYLKDHVGYIYIDDHLSIKEQTRLDECILESKVNCVSYTMGSFLQEHETPLNKEGIDLLLY